MAQNLRHSLWVHQGYNVILYKEKDWTLTKRIYLSGGEGLWLSHNICKYYTTSRNCWKCGAVPPSHILRLYNLMVLAEAIM